MSRPGSDGPRVVQLTFHRDVRGRRPEALLDAWPSLTSVAAAAAAAGARVSVVQPADVDRRIRREGVNVHFVREPATSSLRRRAGLWATPLPRRVLDRVAGLSPEVLHVHSLSFPLHVRLLARRLPAVPILLQDHADRVLPGLRRWIQRLGHRPVDGVAFTAREQARPFLDAGAIPPDVAIFEVLEASTHFVPGDGLEARRETGLHGDPCLLWLGHLDANKDPLTVLEGFRRAAPSLPDPHLWCCYRSAPLLDQVEARIDGSPRLRGRVHLLGNRPHEAVEGLLRAADFLVQGSHREGSGFSVIEALACGTPPLVTDIPPLRRITNRGGAGALFPPGDPEGFAEVLLERAEGDRGRARRRARRHFEDRLSYGAIGRQLVAAYRKLLGRPAPAASVPSRGRARDP